jgi:hypothetical protein
VVVLTPFAFTTLNTEPVIELSIDQPVPELIALFAPLMKGLPNWMVGRGFRWKNSARSLPDGVQSNRFGARMGRFFRNL